MPHLHRHYNPDEKQIPYPFTEMFRDILGFLRPHRSRFSVATALRFTSEIAGLYPTYAFAEIVTYLSRYEAGQSLSRLWFLIIASIIAALYRTITVFLAKKIGFSVAANVNIDARLQAAQHLFALDLSWHEKENTGNKLKRVENGAVGLDRILRTWIANFLQVGVNFIGMTFIIATFELTLGAIFIVFVVSFLLLSNAFFKKTGQAAYEENVKSEQMHGLLFESLNNVRTVKVSGMSGPMFQRIHAAASTLYEKIVKVIFLVQSRGQILSLYSHIFRFGGLIFIIIGIVKGHYELGLLVLFNGYFGLIWDLTSEFSENIQDVVIAKQSLARMKEILQEPIRIEVNKGKKRFPRAWERIFLRNVSFSYGDHPALSDVSFSIARGEKVGIVGPSGAGKSTLFKLLLKESEGFTGEIVFNDVPIQKLKKTDYSQHVAVVLQDSEVFNFSLRDNITLSCFEQCANAERLKRALEIAHVDEFAYTLPQGVDSLIGEKGIKLSGGQKQRVCLARAIFQNPQILFLDEATSHLDLESEEKIRDSLHQFFQDITAVVIAHRLTTIKEMDKIVVLEKGRVIEIGSFQDLYAQKGRFFELWEKQKL